MEDKRSLIEYTVRSCISRLDSIVTEKQIQSMIDKLVKMKNVKEVVDSLALNIDKLFGSPEQKEQYDACMEDLLQLAKESYKSKEDIIAQVQDNKLKNYTPGNISVEENHELIKNSLKLICDKLNELGVDYYLVGALSAFIRTRNTII